MFIDLNIMAAEISLTIYVCDSTCAWHIAPSKHDEISQVWTCFLTCVVFVHLRDVYMMFLHWLRWGRGLGGRQLGMAVYHVHVDWEWFSWLCERWNSMYGCVKKISYL